MNQIKSFIQNILMKYYQGVEHEDVGRSYLVASKPGTELKAPHMFWNEVVKFIIDC